VAVVVAVIYCQADQADQVVARVNMHFLTQSEMVEQPFKDKATKAGTVTAQADHRVVAEQVHQAPMYTVPLWVVLVALVYISQLVEQVLLMLAVVAAALTAALVVQADQVLAVTVVQDREVQALLQLARPALVQVVVEFMLELQEQAEVV
jgi:hypothetical protein